MSYYASGGGTILLQKENEPGYKAVAEALNINTGEKEKILDALFNRILYDFESYERDFEDQGDCLLVSVSHPYTHYRQSPHA